jgi:2-polyprenyl-3-methyl-5-hydroxy-6-metoxy-1,4-benzoquinol methylase
MTNYDLKQTYDLIYKEVSLYNQEIYPDKFKVLSNYIKDIDKTDKILDIGCGRGHYLKWLQSIGYEDILGIELSEFCSKNYLKNLPHKNMNFLDYSKTISDKFYDFSLCMDVVEHIPIDTINLFLGESARISKKIIYGVANHSDMLGGIELHLIQENNAWWNGILKTHFSSVELIHENYEKTFFMFICR